MKKTNLKKGFTLIELLVVVAIIGVLASVVLASLNTARSKGGDAAVKANLANIRGQAELIYSNAGCYGDGDLGDSTCAAFAEAACSYATDNSLFKNSVVQGQVKAAIAAGGSAGGVCSSEASGAQWGVAVGLKTITANSWCVDST